MSKEEWIEAYEKFVEENGREPSDEEMQKFFANHVAEKIDHAADKNK
jgi:hypothetical protein